MAAHLRHVESARRLDDMETQVKEDEQHWKAVKRYGHRILNLVYLLLELHMTKVVTLALVCLAASEVAEPFETLVTFTNFTGVGTEFCARVHCDDNAVHSTRRASAHDRCLRLRHSSGGCEDVLPAADHHEHRCTRLEKPAQLRWFSFVLLLAYFLL